MVVVVMGAADEGHEDRPDASLVEDFPAKRNTVAKGGGVTVQASTERATYGLVPHIPNRPARKARQRWRMAVQPQLSLP